MVSANQPAFHGSERWGFCYYDEDDYSYDEGRLLIMFTMRMQFGTVGCVLLSFWIIVGLLLAINPQRFFSVLSLGRVLLPAKLVGAFRVLGVLNAAGSVYLMVR